MRPRSLSVFVSRDDNRLSRKFEGVTSDNEANSDSENEETEMDLEETKVAVEMELSEGWTKGEYDTLVSQLKDTLPKKDVRKWKTTLDAVDWANIKVGKRPAEEVERIAKEAITKTRSFRTLSEMLEDVPGVVTKLLCAERPKPPLTAYSLFVKEKLPQLREEHKDLKVQQIFKLIPEHFKALSVKKRQRYEADAAKKKEEYHKELRKFYQEHPDLSPKPSSRSRKAPLKTPFHLFYQERRGISSNISLNHARKEWESLPLKKKVVYIQRSFDVQGDTKLKLVNKKEQQMLEESLGKPEFCGRNVFEFYRRKMKIENSSKEHDTKVRAEYKNLSEAAVLALKVEYQQARTVFVDRYRKYITKLPKEKQQAEIDFLTSISEKKSKRVKTESAGEAAEEDQYLGSPEDPPAAESTTIKKKAPAKAGKLDAIKKEQHKSDNSDADSVARGPTSPKKKASKAAPAPAAVPAAVASPSKRKQPVSVKQSPSASSSDEEAERSQTKRRSTAGAAPPSPVKNGTKRASSELPEASAATPKAKKSKVRKEPEPAAPPTPTPKSKPKEPEKPPRDAEEFYRQRIYKGKLGKHKESYGNLSSAKKRDIAEQLKAAQKQYIVDFEVFLKSLPKEEIRKYIQQKVNTQKKANDDDDDDDDDEEEEGSSSGEEEEDEDDD